MDRNVSTTCNRFLFGDIAHSFFQLVDLYFFSFSLNSANFSLYFFFISSFDLMNFSSYSFTKLAKSNKLSNRIKSSPLLAPSI